MLKLSFSWSTSWQKNADGKSASWSRRRREESSAAASGGARVGCVVEHGSVLGESREGATIGSGRLVGSARGSAAAGQSHERETRRPSAGVAARAARHQCLGRVRSQSDSANLDRTSNGALGRAAVPPHDWSDSRAARSVGWSSSSTSSASTERLVSARRRRAASRTRQLRHRRGLEESSSSINAPAGLC